MHGGPGVLGSVRYKSHRGTIPASRSQIDPATASPWTPTNQCPMHPRPAQVQLNVPLPAADYRIYVSAARKLRRIMGHKAPDALNLVKFSLQGRDATGVADDYLDSVRWPHAAGRIVSLRRPAKPTRRIPRLVARAPLTGIEPRLPAGRMRPLADPSRN